jgi:putative DNA primase/helicase
MVPKYKQPEKPWSEMSSREIALYLMQVGMKVLPLHGVNADGSCSCNYQHDAKSIGKHPVLSEWAVRAQAGTPSDLADWFPDGVERNVGIYCLGSGFMVVDEDPRNGSISSAYAMDCATEGAIPNSVSTLTGEYFIDGELVRGTHTYLLHESAERILGSISTWKGIDFKHNGYVVAPGSKHSSGVRYEWAPGRAPWEIEIAPAPVELLGYITGKNAGKPKTYAHKNSLGNSEWSENYEALLNLEVTPTPYAKKSLQNLEQEVATAPKGTRNNTINAACYVAGQLVAGGQIGYLEARKTIWNAAVKNYGSDFDSGKEKKLERVMREFGGGFELGALEPRYQNELTPEQINWAKRVSNESPSLAFEDLELQMMKGFLDNRGNLLLETVIQTLESISPLATGSDTLIWYYSDGYWRRGGDKEVIRNLQVLLGEKARSSHITNVIDYLQARHPEIIGVGDPNYLNCPNGMLDWKSGELLPHDPKYFSTYQLKINWNPSATSEVFDAWLETVVDKSLVELLWEVAGVAVYPGLGFHKAIFLLGSGRNGKGTFLRMIENLVPKSARTNIEPHRIAHDRFATAQLFGRILNICGDISDDALKDTSRFKMVTGEDEIPAEFKHKDSFSFTSAATQLFAANNMPTAHDSSKGFFSRLLIIPFDKVSLDDDQIDKSLEPRMWLELEGVLVKAVQGLQRAMARGSYLESPNCKRALKVYSKQVMDVESFIDEMLFEFPGEVIPQSELYQAYRTYCRHIDVNPKTVIAFNKNFKKETAGRIIERQITGGIDVYEGFALQPFGGVSM